MMNITHTLSSFFIILFCCTNIVFAKTNTVKSWTEIRDHKTIKQTLDISCGAASVATVLNYYYGEDTSESDILDHFPEGVERVTMRHLINAVELEGHRSVAITATYEDLTNLKTPVIVYINHKNIDHFTVVSGVSSRIIKTSDSSLGNVFYTKNDFQKKWELFKDKNGNAVGKILAILPSVSTPKINNDFFGEISFKKTILSPF